MKKKPREPRSLKKPTRPEPPKLEEEDYDDGDPYSCMAAGAAGVEMKNPNYPYLLGQAFENGNQAQVQELIERDIASVKTALWDLWNRGRNYRSFHNEGKWAAKQMELLGDSSLVDYDEAFPAH